GPIARASASMPARRRPDRKSTRLNSSHDQISYAVFCLKKKNENTWMIGDRKKNEIRRLELGLKNVTLTRTKYGYFAGSNFPINPKLFIFFFFNDTATTEIYTLSLHDALPI